MGKALEAKKALKQRGAVLQSPPRLLLLLLLLLLLMLLLLLLLLLPLLLPALPLRRRAP